MEKHNLFLRPQAYEAVRWSGTEEEVASILDWMNQDVPADRHAYADMEIRLPRTKRRAYNGEDTSWVPNPADRAVAFHVGHGRLTITEGDWIFRDGRGEFLVLQHEEVQKKYVEKKGN